jgi:hypothetical protein
MLGFFLPGAAEVIILVLFLAVFVAIIVGGVVLFQAASIRNSRPVRTEPAPLSGLRACRFSSRQQLPAVWVPSWLGLTLGQQRSWPAPQITVKPVATFRPTSGV